VSEYLSKKVVLEWLNERRYKSPWIESFRDRLESGAFDADTSEIQRLRAALEEVRECLDDFWDRDTPRRLYKEVRRFAGQIHVMEKVINQALSTTSEPTNAAKVKRIECPCCGCEISINTPEGDGNDA